jgi:N-acyl-D-amino-acid deacylase
MAKVEHSGTSLNIAMLVGHSMIRGAVMGNDWRRKASGAEIEKMKALVEEAMRSGAFGISAGVDQPWPGLFASTEELVELAKVAQKYGGIYSPHTRGIRSGWFTDDPEKVAYAFFLGPPEDIWVGRFRGYLEAIEVARQARIPLLIAHFSDAYKIPQPHPAELERATAKATLSEIIDKARAEGINVTYNVIATEAGISGHLPMIEAFYDNAATPALNWIKEFSREEFVERLKTREFRARIRRAEESCSLKFGMIHTKEDPYWMNCFKITASQNKEYEEKTIGQIAGVKKTDALETIFDLLVEDPKITWVQFLDRRSTEATLEVFLKHPAASPCTDMDVLPADPDSASDSLLSFYGLAPIAFGMFADYFGTLVRDRGILTIEEAVKKATSFPAQILGIKDRGYLAADAYADVVLFDLRTIRMTGDFKKPAQRPEGIKFVLVNGKVVYRDKAHTGEKPGKVLRHKF